MTRIKIIKSDHVAINMFTADVNKIIRELTGILEEMFSSFRRENCGSNVSNVTLQLFDEWLTRNLLPKVDETIKVTVKEIKKTKAIDELKAKLMKKLSTFTDVDEYVVNVVAEAQKWKSVEECAKVHVWEIYRTHLENFLVQTATLIAGRLLMHMVGIDREAWQEIKVQKRLANPYLSFYWIIRREMSEILPSTYALNELDWIYVPDTVREGLEKQHSKALRHLEMQLDKYVGTTYDLLRGYNFKFVDLDIWKAVYQNILSPEEVNRLGFVTTPDEIVDLILDLAAYSSSSKDLCKCQVLDPACGSGTFLVEALSRLRKHLETNMACHQRKRNEPIWVMQKRILETILSNINGIDINPFATFLTTMNLTFQVIDIYSEIRQKYQNFSLSFNIATHDSLAKKPSIQEIGPQVNSRVKEAVRRSKQFLKIYDRHFHLVVGNPPWGAVLRGAIGPLGDENRRKFYKKSYDSPTGKYDYYVLFMERGIKWLKERGLLAMITQVTYVSQAFGAGIKGVIKDQTSCEMFIDISSFGPLIFPRWSNYPAITILRKGGDQKKLILVEVKQA